MTTLRLAMVALDLADRVIREHARGDWLEWIDYIEEEDFRDGLLLDDHNAAADAAVDDNTLF